MAHRHDRRQGNAPILIFLFMRAVLNISLAQVEESEAMLILLGYRRGYRTMQVS